MLDNGLAIRRIGRLQVETPMAPKLNHVIHPLLIGMLPLKVAVFDHDFGSLKWSSKLLMHDPRTTVVCEANSPRELIRHLKRRTKTDAILLDIEDLPSQISVEKIISSVLTHSSNAVILCLSNRIDAFASSRSIPSGVQAYLLKSELGMGIATAVTLACRRWFVFTPSLWHEIRNGELFLDNPGVMLNWEPNPQLTPSLQAGFELRVMYRMRAPLAAIEIHKSTQTIEKYVSLSYMRLEERCSDDLGLEVINWENLSAEDRAFILYTQPETTKLPLAD
jgi:hypothetical protein